MILLKPIFYLIYRVIYVYNPTDQRRVQIVKLLIDTYQVYVTSNNKVIDSCQIDPSWTGRKSNMMEKNTFEVCLIIKWLFLF